MFMIRMPSVATPRNTSNTTMRSVFAVGVVGGSVIKSVANESVECSLSATMIQVSAKRMLVGAVPVFA